MLSVTIVRNGEKMSSMLNLLCKSSQKLVLLGDGLESAVTILGGSIDELDVERFLVRSPGTDNKRLTKSDRALLGACNATFNHEPVFIHNTIVREATNRGYTLLS